MSIICISDSENDIDLLDFKDFTDKDIKLIDFKDKNLYL